MPTIDIKVYAPKEVVMKGQRFACPKCSYQEQDPKIIISFADFIRNTIMSDPSFGKTWDDLLSAGTIRDRLDELDEETKEAQNVETVLKLDERDFERLYKVAKEPQAGYNPIVGVQILDFIRAIKNARNP